ncbi:nucleoporin [Thraustotheca clavata]|uniref:Nucleoporin n=1 Tax=Thraustotheca clavata TaxID=74557 RepID=A0A1W0A2H7_9STRA|nr:nucleoporin [Thraustotheca clavata]
MSPSESIAELRRVAIATFDQDKSTGLVSRLRQAQSSPLEATYVSVEASLNGQVHPSSEIAPWPALLHPFLASASFGLFQSLKCAWLIHGCTLYLWDYTTCDKITTCPAIPDPILACGVTKPLPGTLFSEAVEYLLVLTTEKEVRLFAMVADNTMGGWKVQDTQMTAMVPQATMFSTVLCTPSRKILLGGVDGALYEYTYHPHLPKAPATEKARSIRLATSHWNNYLPPIVRDLIVPTKSAIAQLVHDDNRCILYALHSSGHVSVFHTRKDIVFITYSIIDPKIVSINIVGEDDAIIHAVAITSSGHRHFLSTYESNQTGNGNPPETCRVVFSRPPPPQVIASDRAIYTTGVSFFAHKAQLITTSADVSCAKMYRELVVAHPLLGSGMVVEEQLAFNSVPAPVVSLKRTADGTPATPSLDFLKLSKHELSTQFIAHGPRTFVCLTQGGLQTWQKQRPIDHLRFLLQQSPTPLPATMIESYGPQAIVCMLFALACEPSPPRSPTNMMSLVFEIGGHPENDSFSNHYTGLVRCIVRFLCPIWNASLTNTKAGPKPTYLCALQKKQLERPRDLLFRLKQLMEQVAVPYAIAIKASNVQNGADIIQKEQKATQNMHNWIQRCLAALEGLLLMLNHPTAWANVASKAFYDILCTDAGSKALSAMLTTLCKETPSIVPTALALCGPFFTLCDAGPFQGMSALTKAKAAATPTARDAALAESLQQFVAAAPSWPSSSITIAHLEKILQDYELCSFWKGLVELTVAVAARFPAHSPQQHSCYSGLLSALGRLAEQVDSESIATTVVGLVLASPDTNLQTVILQWCVARRLEAWLVSVPLTPVVKAVLGTETDWLAALCLHHQEYEEAATILWNAAHDLSVKRPIHVRTQWIARALSCIQHTSNQQNIKDIADALDVFQTQTRLLNEFRSQNFGTPALIETLEYKILDMSTLFHEYAMPYGLYGDCLRIMHSCNLHEPRLIESLWKRAMYSLLPQVSDRSTANGTATAQWLDQAYGEAGLGSIVSMSSSFEASEWQRSIDHLIVSLGRMCHPSPVFPVEWIITEVEQIAMMARPFGIEWQPVHLFVDMGMSAVQVMSWYLHAFSSSHSKSTKIQYLRSILSLYPSCEENKANLPSSFYTTLPEILTWVQADAPEEVVLLQSLRGLA